MKYLLDTCVISDFIKGCPETLQQLKKHSPAEITISSITVMEIQYGLFLNPTRANQIRPIIHTLIDKINVIDFSSEDAREAAAMRALLKQQGNVIGSYDILLAGAALNRKLILVSSNVSEFERIEGLTLENWRKRN